MLYVAGFNEKKSPQVYVIADDFAKAFKRVEDWLITHRQYTLVCVNEFVTDGPIEISSNSYMIDTRTNKLIPRDELVIYGIRYAEDKDELNEKEKVIIAVEMGSIAYSSPEIIKGLWRITGENDIVLI